MASHRSRLLVVVHQPEFIFHTVLCILRTSLYFLLLHPSRLHHWVSENLIPSS